MPNSPAGYVPPNADEIRGYLTNKGWVDQSGAVVGDGTAQGADNARLIHAEAAKYGLSAQQLDSAMGWDAGATDRFSAAAGMARLRGYHDLIGANAPAQPPAPGTSQPPPAAPNPYTQAQPPAPSGGSPNPYLPQGQQPQPMPQGQPGQQNPYMQQMGDNITRQVTNNLQRNILPGIGRGAVAAGGYGGSRQGIAEGLAIGETNNNLSGQLANLYGNQFNTDRNYGLANDAMDLNVYNANQNWMNQGQQMQLNTLDKIMGWNQNAYNTATNVQNTPLNYYQQFANIGQGLGGMGSQNSQNMQGNPWLGALAGYQFGSQIKP